MRQGRQRRRHLAAATALLALAILFYYPLTLQHRILVGYDIFTYFYPNASYATEVLRSGRLPLWNPYLFTGVPFLANMQTAVLYPLNLLFLFLPVPRAFAISIVLHVFLAALFSYWFSTRVLRLGSLPALVVGQVYAFGGFVGALAGHPNQLQASAWLPLILLLADEVYRKRSARLALVASLVVAVQFLAGHLQEFYLSMVGLALYVAWLATSDVIAGRRGRAVDDYAQQGDLVGDKRGGVERNKRREPGDVQSDTAQVVMTAEYQASVAPRAPTGVATIAHRVACVALMVGMGVALTAAQFLPTYELTKESIRAGGLSYQEATHFSLPPWLLLRALLPAHGDPQPFSEWIGYVGVVGVILAGFGLLRRPRHRLAPCFAGMALLSIFLALGLFNPLYPLLYRVMPGLNMFRVPARWLLLYSFAMAALAGMGAQALAAQRNAPAVHQLRQVLNRLVLPMLAVGVILLLLALAPNPRGELALPRLPTAALWTATLLVTLGAIALAAMRRTRLSLWLVVALVSAELFSAGRGMDFNNVNLPESYSALRPAVAHLLAQPGIFRVLAFSEGIFEPGDMAQLKEMVGQVLPAQGVYDYIVATKHKETLTPNLPLQFRIASLDGYDGGVLPLRRYVDLKQLLPLAKHNTADGRLREQLSDVPDINVLSWLNVKYVLQDRVHDVWVDGVYYDLGLSRAVSTEATLALTDIPALSATNVGIVSHLQNASRLAEGTAVAQLAILTDAGGSYTTTLRAGVDSAEGTYEGPGGEVTTTSRRARRVRGHPGDGETMDYVTIVPLPTPGKVTEIRLTGLVDRGGLVLRGISVIDERRQLSEPVVIDPDMHMSYLGDVKIYENRRALPRAIMLHDVVTAPSENDALAVMQQPSFDLARQVLLTPDERAKIGGEDWQPRAATADDQVEILEYQPEKIRIRTTSESAGLLMLTDTYYPGWRASIDGQAAPVLRADYLFRAVPLPAGQHVVTFSYEPDSVRLGITVSISALGLVLAGLVAMPLLRHRYFRGVAINGRTVPVDLSDS